MFNLDSIVFYGRAEQMATIPMIRAKHPYNNNVNPSYMNYKLIAMQIKAMV